MFVFFGWLQALLRSAETYQRLKLIGHESIRDEGEWRKECMWGLEGWRGSTNVGFSDSPTQAADQSNLIG